MKHAHRLTDKKPVALIQNKLSWCWSVCAKIVGDQYKRVHPCFDFHLSDLEKQYPYGMPADELSGCRMEYLGMMNGAPTVDLWQWLIVKAAQCGQSELGTDENKMRAVKFVVTGDPLSSRITVNSYGQYASGLSLHPFYEEVLSGFLRDGYFAIGNYYASRMSFFHSVVIRRQDDSLSLYDPWDGSEYLFSAEQLFVSGFVTNLGKGLLEWVQY